MTWYRAWSPLSSDENELITQADSEEEAIYLLLNDGREYNPQQIFVLAEPVGENHPLWEDWMVQE